jgi:hypothetical protein
MRTRLVNVPIKFEEEIEVSQDEQVQLAVADAETRKKTYLALRAQNLPIPDDLRQDFEPKAHEVGKGNPMVEDEEDEPELPMPTLGLDTPPTPALAPTEEDLEAADEDPTDPAAANADGSVPGPGLAPGPAQPPGKSTDDTPTPRNKWKQRPPESDEARGAMPKGKSGSLHYASIEDIEAAYENGEMEDMDGELPAPWHIGMRRTRQLDPDKPLDEQLG